MTVWYNFPNTAPSRNDEFLVAIEDEKNGRRFLSVNFFDTNSDSWRKKYSDHFKVVMWTEMTDDLKKYVLI